MDEVVALCSIPKPYNYTTVLHARFDMWKTTSTLYFHSINPVGCNSTHFGIGCDQTCPCNTTNTLDCDDNDGTCTCLPNWSGTVCTIDVNECSTNSSACNTTTEECVNNDGGFSCVCLYGNSSTGCIGIIVKLHSCNESYKKHLNYIK